MPKEKATKHKNVKTRCILKRKGSAPYQFHSKYEELKKAVIALLNTNMNARIYSIKSQLRNSADQTRKDISNAIDHQLQCIRAREQELLFNLEDIMAKKELMLCEQQEKLNQAIGACQQSLECVLSRNNTIDSSSVQNMLLRMNSIDLRPKENSNILFEFDPSDLRRNISTFGCIIAGDEPKALESLPLDVEHYDEDANFHTSALTHKSVLRLHPTSNNFLSAEKSPVSKKQLTPFSESINFWLSQMKPPTTALDCEEEFDYIRDRITSMSGSSFEVVNNASNDKSKNAPAKPDEIFSVHFSEINNLPSDFWLNKSMLKSQIKPANPLTPKGSSYATRAPLPELSKLIKEIKLDSSEEEPLKAAKITANGLWKRFSGQAGLISRSKQSSPPLLHSSCSAENMDEAEKVCGVQIDTKSEGDFRGLNKKKRFWQPVGGILPLQPLQQSHQIKKHILPVRTARSWTRGRMFWGGREHLKKFMLLERKRGWRLHHANLRPNKLMLKTCYSKHS
uniref:Uncharacterized protein n=1 Tax=Ditylenchus dipsaci TaxID=166011 RepID=A0A915E0Z5_9BILA